MLRIPIAFLIALSANVALANGGKMVYQTLPNSSTRDYNASAHVTKGNTTYQTLPGSTTRDGSVALISFRDDHLTFADIMCSSSIPASTL